jgi:hypothetical protein
MNKAFLLVLLSLCLGTASLKSMEEQVEKADALTFAALPPEMLSFLIQFLGADNLTDTFKNISRLALVDTTFNELLEINPALVTRMIKAKFSQQALFDWLLELLRKGTIAVLKPVFRWRLLEPITREVLFLWMVNDGNEPAVKEFLNQDRTLINAHSNQFSALHYAVSRGLYDLAQLLVEQNANVDAQSPLGNSPLMVAAAHDHEQIVDLLLDHDADIDLTNKAGETAFHIAQSTHPFSKSRDHLFKAPYRRYILQNCTLF